jgi:hypothetical protein
MVTQFADREQHVLFAGSINSVGRWIYQQLSVVGYHFHEKCTFRRAFRNLYFVIFLILGVLIGLHKAEFLVHPSTHAYIHTHLSCSGHEPRFPGRETLLGAGEDAGDSVRLRQQRRIDHGEAESGQDTRQTARKP